MTNISPIDEGNNRAWNKWRATAIEWLAVIIASVSGVVSLISMFVTAICVGIILAQQGRIEELSDKIGVMEVYITQHESKGE